MAEDAAAQWATIVDQLGLEGFARQLARNCGWLGREADTVRLSLDVKARHLLNDERREAIARALSVQLDTPLTVQIDIGGGDVLSPAQLAVQREADRQQEAESAIFADPVVRAFREQFGATIKPGSIHPLDS